MKVTLLLGLLATTSFTSASVQPSTHAMAVAVSLFTGPLPAFAKPVWRYTSTRLSPRQANSTTGAATGTYTVVSGDTLSAIAAAEGISTQALEDANPSVVPTDLQVGQVLNVPSSTSSNGTSSSDSPAAMQSNSVDASDLGDGVASGSSAAETGTGTGTGTGTAPKSTASGCGGGHHHHHDNSTATAGSSAKARNGTDHHSHNGTATEHHAHNSTLVDVGAGECNATSHHHHNGTETGTTTTAGTFFVPVTATASALAVALTAPAAARDVDAGAAGGFGRDAASGMMASMLRAA